MHLVRFEISCSFQLNKKNESMTSSLRHNDVKHCFNRYFPINQGYVHLVRLKNFFSFQLSKKNEFMTSSLRHNDVKHCFNRYFAHKSGIYAPCSTQKLLFVSIKQGK